MKKLLQKLKCYFAGHKWTCLAQKGIKATDQQLKSYEGFKDYAKMFCDRCGHESKLNARL